MQQAFLPNLSLWGSKGSCLHSWNFLELHQLRAALSLSKLHPTPTSLTLSSPQLPRPFFSLPPRFSLSTCVSGLSLGKPLQSLLSSVPVPAAVGGFPTLTDTMLGFPQPEAL